MRPRELIGCRTTLVSIVWRCLLDVSAYVALGQQVEVGEHACPGPNCERRRLSGWSGYWRWVRGPGTQQVWIRRGRCSSCLHSHALLPDFLLERRLDEVEVIGHALALGIVGGLGMRSMADRLGVPMTTARGWRRRFQVRAPVLAAALVAVAVQLDPTAVSWPVKAKPPSSKRSAQPGSERNSGSVNAHQPCGVSGVSSARPCTTSDPAG